MRLPALLPDDDTIEFTGAEGRQVQTLFARYDRLSDADLGDAIESIFSGAKIASIAAGVGLSIGDLRRNFRSVGVRHA